MSTHGRTVLLPRPVVPGVDLAEPLGEGTYGVVYRGLHRALKVPVAVKLVQGAARHGAAFEAALREAHLMARLDHPNVLRVFDAGASGDALYLVIELMDSSLEAQRMLSPGRLVEVAAQLLSGLQALHDARIVHRDLKPANCLVRNRDGRVKLADLGIALERADVTREPASFAGSLAFMAPELFEPSPRYSPASDLYALGMTLYCLALEQDPFAQCSSMAELLAWLRAPPPKLGPLRPDLPPSAVALLEALVARSPEARPASATEALMRLGPLSGTSGGSPSLAPPSSSPPEAPAEARTRQVGPWRLGSIDFESDNWCVRVATHERTGVPARFCHLQPGSLRKGIALLERSCHHAWRFDQPALLAVLDWGRHEGRPFMVTQSRGQRFDLHVQASGPLDEATALELLAGLADGVAWLHERNLVYQLVLPDSVFFARDVRMAQLGWPLFCTESGTPAKDAQGQNFRALMMPYLAPEVLENAPTIEPAVDLYGLGEVLWFAVTGASAFPDDLVPCYEAKRSGVRADDPRLAKISHPTRLLLERLLHPDPARRPAAATLGPDLLRHARRLRPSEA